MKNILVLIIGFIIINVNHTFAQWTEANSGFYGGMTTSFVYKDGLLFAGAAGSGIYRSSNNGNTWTALRSGLPLLGTQDMIVVDNQIFAGTSGGGIYVTSNNGDNWSASNTGLSNLNVLSLLKKGLLVFAGTTTAGLFKSTNNGNNWQLSNSGLPNASINKIINIGDSLYLATSSGVYLSSNNGSTWVSRNGGLTSTDINSITFDGLYLYAASHTNGVFVSTDKGDNWSNSSNGITNLSVLDIENNITKVFAATNGGGMFYSFDRGANWFPANNGLVNTYILKLFYNGSNLYAGTDGGAFYSTDEGNIWNDITNGLTNSVIINFANDDLNDLYAGTYGRGAFKSINGGTSWFEINSGLEELYCYSLIAKSSSLFAGLWNGQVCRSSDLGGSWNTVVNKTNPRSMVWSFSLIGTNLFHGNSLNGVYLSTNDGLSWSPVNNGLTNTNVRSMTSNGANLFAGTTGGGIYISTNNGANWQPVNTGLPNLNINCLTSAAGNLYAGTSSNGVCVSTNNGTSWQNLNNGMTSQAKSVAVIGSTLIAATSNGVFYSSNNGANWQTANGGLLNMNCWAIAINGTKVFLGTFGNGVFKADISSFTGAGLSITTGTVSSPLCAGASILVPYTVSGNFNSGNIFTAQLSNASGSFTLPTVIGALSSTTSGTINCTIPNNITAGTGYRIRVVSSNPAVNGTDNGTNITINSLPVPVISGPDAVCQNTSQTFTTTGVLGHSYSWSATGGNVVGSANLTSVVINWTTSNPSGTVTLTETVNATGCRDSAIKSVIVNPAPNPVVSGADTSCNRNTHLYNCSLVSGHSYIWGVSGGNIENSNANSANIYWNTSNSFGVVSVTETIEATGCELTASKTVTILKMPSPTVLGTFDVCNKSYQNYSTTFTPADTYLWKVNGGSIVGNDNQLNVNVYWNTAQSSGTLTLIETNSATLCKDSAVKIVNVFALPAPQITGTNVSYTDSVEEYSTTAVFGNSFHWIVAGGTIVGENNNIETKIKWLSPPSGTVTLVQTVDSSGCRDSTSNIVTIKPFSTYFSGHRQVCENTVENYSASNVNDCSYNWNISGGDIIGAVNQPEIQVQWHSIGAGSIKLVMTVNSSGYKDSSFSSVTIYPMPSAPPITGNSSSCANKIETYYTESVSGFTFKWIAKGGFIVSDDKMAEVQVRWLSEPSGTITVVKTITGSGCSSSANQIVSIFNSPSPKIQGATSSLNNADEHYSVANNQGSTYKWFVTGGTFNGADNLPEVDIHWGESTSGNLKAIETNSDGCADSNEINVALFVSSVNDIVSSSNIRIKIIPNPVNGKAKLEITAKGSVNAGIQIVNSLGEIVKDFGNQLLNEGTQNIDWDGNDIDGISIPSGIYFIKLNSKFGVAAEKVMILR
ncbi:MAG: T9SS type A sorting domain-containing protein [Bacteroidetes bacterium]|nr:MAG: T9SS type A sorting domain-containing protein [Bacteroidota bacterium]